MSRGKKPGVGRIGRRSFIRLTAAGTAGLYLTGCDGASDTPDSGPGDSGPEPVERVRALVLGSGFGGSIAALRLAEAGLDVTMLERGRRWEITEAGDTFTSMQDPDGRAAWMHGSPVLPGYPEVPLRGGPYGSPYVGLLQRFEGPNIDVIAPAGVGGGSLVYSGLMLQPPRALFESVMPSEVDYTEMDTVYYPRVRAIMQPQTLPDDLYNADEYVSSRLFIRDAEAAGLDVERRIVAFNFDVIRGELEGTIPRQCTNGDYIYGLNSGAKHSIDRIGYLNMAEATGRVDVRPLHQVSAIGETEDGLYRADVERIDEHGNVVERLVFEAECMFVACGAMNTAKLFLKAQRDGTLSGLNDQIGNDWGNNGQRILVRSRLTEDTGALQGGPACIFLHHHDNPEGPIGMEFGPAPIGFESHSLICATQGVPERLGQLRLDSEGQVYPEWDRTYDAAAGRASQYTLSQIVAAAGGEIGSLLTLNDPSVTFHPLGGMSMGRATDTFGRVLGKEHLYVVDSSLIPGSTPAGNPFWTIAALAERAMDTIIREDLNPDA